MANNIIFRFCDYLSLIKDKKRFLFSFLFGSILTLAFAPVFFIPAAFVAFAFHLIQLDYAKNKKDAFWLGWWFGFGHFVTGLYWISFALLTDVAKFWWLVPFAVFGLPSIIAIYTGVVSCVVFAFKMAYVRKVVFFSCVWAIIEIARSYLFTGFPWNLLGYVWASSDSVLQITSVGGIFLLSLISVFVFSLPYLFIEKINGKYAKSQNAKTALILILVIGCVVFAFGHLRLQNAENKFVDNINLRVVQANIAQTNKWDANYKNRIVEKYFAMSSRDGEPTHIIWPESAIPYFLQENTPLEYVLQELAPENGAIITGSIHGSYSEHGFLESIYNSIHVISGKNGIEQVYNKHHLVPFGEYVPLRSVLPIEKITYGALDFSQGVGLQTINAQGFVPFSPLICYEAIFSGAAVEVNDYPKAMINVTNDAWYGNTSGPYQHFYMVKVRAVEQGVPLIRAANTGISGVFDSYGRIIAKTELSKEAVLDSGLPVFLKEKTIFAKFDKIVVTIMILFGLFVCFFRKK